MIKIIQTIFFDLDEVKIEIKKKEIWGIHKYVEIKHIVKS